MQSVLIKPDWIKIRYAESDTLRAIKQDVKQKGLATVCQESMCPNISECWTHGTATFMLMGDTCTRGCRFCHVKTSAKPAPLDPQEPQKLLESIKTMGLTYSVLTSVDRDDLPDQGAPHLASCIRYIKTNLPQLKIEILIPDFQGNLDLVKQIIDAGPDVMAHNIETVERLTPNVRDRRAKYRQSLSVLEGIKRMSPKTHTKSSIMVGLGETKEEVLSAMDDLRSVGVSFLTIGQYLRPSGKQLPVIGYIHPDTFKYYKDAGIQKGFSYVAAGPFVRSSYRAGELFIAAAIDAQQGK